MRKFAVPAIITGIAVALLVLLAVGLSGEKTNNSIAFSVQSHRYKVAPDYHRQLPVLSGGDGANTESLADYRGKVVLVNLFAGWCDGCQEEAAVMAKVQRLMTAHNGTVLGITYQDSPGDALGFMRQYHLNYPVLEDVGGNLANSFNVLTIPDSYVLGRDGKIEALNLYPVTMAWVKQNLMPILSQKS
jgi:cytochrome c biogenesis protein CcmG/thiol:disulfide interchange protein DsbE